MDPVSHPFDTHRSSSRRGHQSYQNQGLVPTDGQRKFYFRGEEINWNQNSHVTPASSISPKPKTTDLLNLSDYRKVKPFVRTLFKETRETSPLARKLKYFLKNWEKVPNDSTILSIVKGYSIQTLWRLLTNQEHQYGQN